MIRILLLAALLVGGGSDTAMVDHQGGPMGSLVGGIVMLDGGDMNRSFSFGRVNARPGRSVIIVGGGDNQQVVDSQAAPGR